MVATLVASIGLRRGREELVGVRAAVLEEFGKPLVVGTVPDPEIGTGEVVVDVLAAGVLPFAAEVFGGQRRYSLEPPVIPGVGGIGRVVALAADATRLRVGDVVWCDPAVRSRDQARTPDITLQGWISRGAGGLRLSRRYHHGSYAERMAVPTENVEPLGEVEAGAIPRWAGIGVPLVPYGGLTAVGLQPGESLLVSGATGNFGSSAVAVGLAMGASAVIATGRNESVLADLRHRFGERVRTAALTGDPEADTLAIQAAAEGPIDVVIDLLPPAAGTVAVRTAAMTVREYGRVVLMGGVGMLGGDDLALPYPWLMLNSVTVRGQFMYPRNAIAPLIALARAGLLDLSGDDVTTFDLDRANDAVAHAAVHGGPFTRTVITP
jgi:alcohol dehydrogenase